MKQALYILLSAFLVLAYFGVRSISDEPEQLTLEDISPNSAQAQPEIQTQTQTQDLTSKPANEVPNKGKPAIDSIASDETPNPLEWQPSPEEIEILEATREADRQFARARETFLEVDLNLNSEQRQQIASLRTQIMETERNLFKIEPSNEKELVAIRKKLQENRQAYIEKISLEVFSAEQWNTYQSFYSQYFELGAEFNPTSTHLPIM